MNDLTIEREIIIDASIAKVFRAITNPDQLTQWFPDVALLEPKEGGDIVFTFLKEKSISDKNLDKNYRVVGKVIKIIPNRDIYIN